MLVEVTGEKGMSVGQQDEDGESDIREGAGGSSSSSSTE